MRTHRLGDAAAVVHVDQLEDGLHVHLGDVRAVLLAEPRPTQLLHRVHDCLEEQIQLCRK
jgi:hypothetical protein